MNSDQVVCHCGKKAAGLISDVGWLCKECFDEKMDSIEIDELLSDIRSESPRPPRSNIARAISQNP